MMLPIIIFNETYAQPKYLALAAGVLCYFAYFHRGEHHLHGTTYIKIHTAVIVGSLVFLYGRFNLQLAEALLLALKYDALFLSGLFGSVLLCRALLNPLNAFPGPWTARITSFDMPLRIRKGQMYKMLQDLHGRYGYFVRIGTGELSITHPRAVQDVFGADSKCHKSPWYDISRPQDSLLLRRTAKGHAELRRVWSAAFSTKAIRGYEQRIQPYRNKLIAGLDECIGEMIDMNMWLALYTWDVMGDLTFGHSFGMLDTREQHWAIVALNSGMSVIGQHLPMWLFRILVSIPGAQKDFKIMLDYATEQMLARRKNEPEIPDVMSHIFAPYKNGKPWDAAAINLMAGESHLLLNAGSDTTRTTLAVALFELAKKPEYLQKLFEALAGHISESSNEEILHDQIADIDLLTGVINEALRLYPPNPSHPTRVTPPEGAMIAGKFIPGGTQIFTPQYVIGRDERIYPQANEFIPERWYSSPELVTDLKATAPFSIGPYNCIGKPLAMMNLRVTLARIVLRYNFRFAPECPDPVEAFVGRMHDHFTLQGGPLYLKLERRNQERE